MSGNALVSSFFLFEDNKLQDVYCPLSKRHVFCSYRQGTIGCVPSGILHTRVLPFLLAVQGRMEGLRPSLRCVIRVGMTRLRICLR